MEAISPSELNQTADEELKQRVLAIVRDGGMEPPSHLPPLAAYVTLELLLRLHNHVASYSMDDRCGWPKQAALAKVVMTVTGAMRPKDFTSVKDFESAGNLMDASLSKYVAERKNAYKGSLKSASQARKAGREPPPYTRLSELQERIYRCTRGCTPQNVVLPSVGCSSALPIHHQPTKWTVQDPSTQIWQMQSDLAAAKQAPEIVPVLERRIRAVQNQAAVADRQCHRAEKRAEESSAEVDAQKAKVKQLEERHREAKTMLERERKESERAIKALEDRNRVLGAQIATAISEAGQKHVEAERTAQRAAAAKRAAEQREQILREAKARIAREARDAKRVAEAGRIAMSSSRPTREVTHKRKARFDEAGHLLADDGDEDEASVADDLPFERVQRCLYAEQDAAVSAAAANEAKEAAEAREALKRQREMPTWRAVSRGKGGGKGAAKIEWGTRMIIYSLIGMLVPCSAIGNAIVAIVKRTAPWLNPTSPTVETVQRCRFELRFVEEACPARRVAAAYKVRGIGFDETTKLGTAALTSNLTIEPVEGAQLEHIILRAAYCPAGGTSQKCVESIEKKCVARLRDMLRRWEAKFKQLYPNEEWTGPDPVQCGLHRLGGGGAIMSDTCNPARLAKRLLAEMVAEQVQAHIGADAWATMSSEQQEEASRTHQHDCWQHLRNIFLAEMSKAQAAHMKEELKAELDTFSSWERMSTDYSQLLRASYKEFHHGCRYYKGKGKQYEAWLRETHPKSFVVHLERADGGRQDLDYDAALPIYIDRKYFIEYLHGVVFGKDHSNILEDFLYVTHRSVQFIAATRANAIIDLLISRPLRWLTGNSSRLTKWSPYSMGEALDLIEQFFEKAQHDGSLFLDPSLDILKPIADKQPLFAQWRTYTFTEESRVSPDGTTKHLLYKLARDELLQPSDATNTRTRAKTIEYLEVQCTAALRKMHDPKLALADKLTSLNGANCIGNQEQGHADTMGCEASNDKLAESVFGTFDHVLRRFGGISQEAASAVAQAVRSKILAFGDHIAHRKQSTRDEARREPSYIGWLHELPAHEQEALVELSRTTVVEMRDIDRADHAELLEYHKARQKSNQEEELDALFKRYALALSFFDRWRSRGVTSVADVTRQLNTFGKEGERTQDKLDWLREQIEMRSVGLGWTEWKGQWSSSKDESTGTVSQLKEHLKQVLLHEDAARKKKELPTECPAPLLQRKTFKTLGTPTVQADSLSDDRTQLTSEQILREAEQRRRQLEAAGEIDWVGDRQPKKEEVPLNQSIVGAELEIRWRYRHKDTGESVYIWCTGEVIQVADGDKDRMSARCKKILPAGAVRIKWPADVDYDEQESCVWSILKPSNFNQDVHLGWRLAASEILKREAKRAENPAGKRNKTVP